MRSLSTTQTDAGIALAAAIQAVAQNNHPWTTAEACHTAVAKQAIFTATALATHPAFRDMRATLDEVLLREQDEGDPPKIPPYP
jgi:hypothetical protein